MGSYTWNPDDKHPDIVLSNSNLTATNGVQFFSNALRATDGKTGVKFYFEAVPTYTDDGNYVVIGIAKATTSLSQSNLGKDANSWGLGALGYSYHDGVSITTGSFASGAVVMVAVDGSAGKIWFGVNGVWKQSGDPASGTNPVYSDISGTVYPAASFYRSGNSIVLRPKASDFSYTPPVGFDPYATELGTLTGTVYEKNQSGVYIPGPYPVRVYLRSTGELVATTTSAEDGTYTIENLRKEEDNGDPREYYVMAVDNNSPFQRAGLAEQVFIT